LFFERVSGVGYDRKVPEWCWRVEASLDDVRVWLLGTDVFHFVEAGADVIHG
jgi:hypothetical protein